MLKKSSRRRLAPPRRRKATRNGGSQTFSYADERATAFFWTNVCAGVSASVFSVFLSVVAVCAAPNLREDGFLTAFFVLLGVVAWLGAFARAAQSLATRFADPEIYRKSWARRAARVAFAAFVLLFAVRFFLSFKFE